MNPRQVLRQLRRWLPPQTWPEIFAVIISLLLIFLTVVFLIDSLKGTLP